MQFQYLPIKDLALADDWRPVYHYSTAAELPRIGGAWPRLSELEVKLLDGWRFSDSPESDWYLSNVALRDPGRRDKQTGEYQRLEVSDAQRERANQFRVAIEGERYYRMRHIGKLRLQSEARLMEPPAFSDPTICVAPGDILLRRVGKAGAALVSHYHRRHPVDANIAIIRGLNPREATWLAFCLNQPLYKNYLERQAGVDSMVRVGLKHLAKMPVAPCPDDFFPLVDRFQRQYQTLVRSEDDLSGLRRAVQNWLDQRLPGQGIGHSRGQTAREKPGLAARFFKARDVSERLNYATSEQARLAHQLTEVFGCVALSRLADLNPAHLNECEHQQTNNQVLKIKHLDGQQGIVQRQDREADGGWRVRKRPLSRLDVLVSTFVQEPKVAILAREPELSTRASEQLAVLKFHHSPGAYALLMESPLLRQQIGRLATGTVQRFFQPGMLEHVVLPEIDRDTATAWHYQLLELLEAKGRASDALDVLSREMYHVFRQQHPAIRDQGVNR